MQGANHNRLKRLPAFTILELTVVMLLTSLVIATGYLAWGMVWQQFLGYQKMANHIGEVARIEMVLHNDMEKADRVTRINNTVTFWNPASTNINYELGSTHIVRQVGTHTDTIHVPLTAIDTKMLELGANTGSLVERLEIQFDQYGRTQKMRFTKEYGVAIKMLADQQKP